MKRKIFISILGTGYYQETKYYIDNKNEAIETNFIQEAQLKISANKWGKTDKAFIFLTEDARKTNWESPAQVDNRFVKEGKSTTYEGLKQVLENNKFEFEIIPVDIPNGNNEDEIWQIFETVFNVVEEGDEVYFDITHAFRSIPMLVMVLINYAKFLKNITVKSITYGNWEGRDNENFSPIINLTSFSELQDWTSAANDFVNFGNVDKLSLLSKKDIGSLAREYKGANETVNSLTTISKNLPIFISNIQTCRGKAIIANKEGAKINTEFKKVKDSLIAPLTPILNKIENKIYPFLKEDNLINGFNAVNWCLNNNLYQQGFTILQENIISVICKELNLDENLQRNRNIVSSCFTIKKKNIVENEWKGDAAENKEIARKVLTDSKLLDLLLSDYFYIATVRNDLNHSGYNNGPIKPNRVKGLLNEFYCNVLEKLQLSIN